MQKQPTTTTTPTTRSNANKKIPFTPTRKELHDLYKGISNKQLNKIYAQIRKNHKLKFGQPNCLTSYQFQKFMEELGLPDGFKKTDFPFLDHVEERKIV